MPGKPVCLVIAPVQKTGATSLGSRPELRAEWKASLEAWEYRVREDAARRQSRSGLGLDYAAEVESARAAGDAERLRWALGMVSARERKEQDRAAVASAIEHAMDAIRALLAEDAE